MFVRTNQITNMGSAGPEFLRTGIEFSSRSQKIGFFFAAAVVFLAPLNFLRYPGLYITLGDVFAVLCLLAMIVMRSLPLRPLGVVTAPWMVAAIMLIGGLLFSSLFVGDPWRGMVTSAQYFFCLFVLPLALAWRPESQVFVLVKIFVFSIVMTCVHGIYLIDIVGQTNTRFVSGSGRLMSFVERENEAAGLFALTVPFLLWLRNEGEISLVYFWLALGFISYGIMLTGSNSGIFALMFILAIQFVANFSRKQVIISAVFALAIGFAFANQGIDYLPEVFRKRVLGALTSGDIEDAGSFVDRVGLIRQALEVIDHNGLFGIGADQFQLISNWNAPVHNFYLLIWAEGGFIAFVGYLLILASGFLASIVAFKNARSFYSANCTFSIFITFALLTNAYTHIYARFYFVVLLLAISVSSSAAHAIRN
jgi:O-antigen ligase